MVDRNEGFSRGRRVFHTILLPKTQLDMLENEK
jgi:hypothetical protein